MIISATGSRICHLPQCGIKVLATVERCRGEQTDRGIHRRPQPLPGHEWRLSGREQ